MEKTNHKEEKFRVVWGKGISKNRFTASFESALFSGGCYTGNRYQIPRYSQVLLGQQPCLGKG